MSLFSFGEYVGDSKYKVVNEREIRASSGIMLLLVSIALSNGYFLYEYEIIPYITGFLTFNFIIGIFINPLYAPISYVARLIVRKQSPLYVGAVQKRFAWGIGLIMSGTVTVLSILLQTDISFFQPMCVMCSICLILMYLESAFGLCLGCKAYHALLKFKIIPEPDVRPNCVGDSCDTD